MGFRRAVWLFPTALALHELEEWNILAWYREHWVQVDPLTMTSGSVHVWLIFASVAGFLVTWAAVSSRHFELMARWFVLPLFVVAIFGHALGHIYWTFRFNAYAPGVVTAVGLIIPVTLLLLVRAERDGIITRRTIQLLLLAALGPLVAVVRAGNVVPEGGIPWLRFSTWLMGMWGG